MAEERALRAASRVGDTELPSLTLKIKAFHRGKLEGATPLLHLVRPTLEHFWEVELEADEALLQYRLRQINIETVFARLLK